MEIEPEAFFSTPPRFQAEVGAFIRDLSSRVVQRFAQHARCLGIERLTPQSVKLIVFSICSDPYTRQTRHGLAVQQSKLRNMLKLFGRSMRDAEAAMAHHRYGNIDRMIVQSVQSALAVKHTDAAAVCVAACVATLCGIVLNSTHNFTGDRKVIEVADVHAHCDRHTLSTGEVVRNASMARLLHVLRTPLQDVAPPPDATRPRREKAPNKTFDCRRLGAKTVSFRLDPQVAEHLRHE